MKRVCLLLTLACLCPSIAAAQNVEFKWTDHPTLRVGDWLRTDFRARVQADKDWSELSVDDRRGEALDVARRRVGVEGRIAKIVDYQLEYELEGHEWRDAFLDYRQFPHAQVRAGQFKVPFSLDETTGATKLDFIYRSRVAARLAPGRDQGVAVHGRFKKSFLTYEAGLFRNDGDNARPSATSTRVFGARTTAVRVTVRPFRASRSSLSDLVVGTALSTSRIPEGFSAVRARTVLGASFFDSDVWVNGGRRRLNVETRWRPGPASIQAEYIRLSDERRGESVENTDLQPLVAAGWYLSGTVLLTGERKSDGIEKPARHFGAIELAGRIEKLTFGSTSGSDLSTSVRADRVSGNANQVLTLGVNWYVNRWVKVQGNVIRERLLDPAQGPMPNRPSIWTQLVRLQFTI
jgi:phosphate-selective porin OprO/OprP